MAIEFHEIMIRREDLWRMTKPMQKGDSLMLCRVPSDARELSMRLDESFLYITYLSGDPSSVSWSIGVTGDGAKTEPQAPHSETHCKGDS